MKIGIIGYGIMGRAIAARLRVKKIISRRTLLVSHRSEENTHVLDRASLIILAVKPQNARALLASIRPFVRERHLFFSIMAGISLRTISEATGSHRIIRAMPNTPARIGQGVTVWMATRHVSRREKAIACRIFQSLGKEMEVKRESDIDRATALFGSGPAYIFYFIEAMEEAGRKLEFPKDALLEYMTTMLDGAIHLLRLSGKRPEDLRAQVTSKKGTTHAAIRLLEKKKFKAIVASAVRAAYKRAIKLSTLLHH